MTNDQQAPRFVAVEPHRRPRRDRRAVRIVVIDESDRVLLFRDTDPGSPGVEWWVTPGGGIDPGESELRAGVRELAEETGLLITEEALLGPLARRRVVHGFSDQVLTQDETFYGVRVPGFEIDISGHTEEEKLTLTGHRWWPLAELASPDAWIWPAQLSELVQVLRRHETSESVRVVELGVQDESTVPVVESAR